MTQAHYITLMLRRSWLLALLLALFLTGCQSALDEPVAAVPASPQPPQVVDPTATPAAAAQPTPTPLPAPPAAAPAAAPATQAIEPLAADKANPPVQLRIPSLGLDVLVSPMTWRVTEVNGTRTTAWALPDSGVGWHPNSARAGSVGTVVISGHQLLGDASFAPLALGDVTTGAEILLTDSAGQSFVYRVTAVSDPLPIANASAAESALAAQYIAQGDGATLTLITGWPDFSSTHRIFVAADFQGVQN
ncbi:MAG: sortase [Chloroflexi bacterium]|nr:MAG: sortase [Chloroflexota bacterium]